MNQSVTNLNTPGSLGGDQKVWDRRFIILLSALSIGRLLYLLIVPLDLAPDEAYYWDWSRLPDWCYYSKPPMVAWVMALSTKLLGSTSFTVRLPAVLFWIMGLWFLYLLARRIYGAKVGFYAVLIAITAPGSCALGLIMTIDAPLVFFWALALYSLWRALEDRKSNKRWWILTCIVTGLGLLSKQTMLFFLPLVLLFIWVSPTHKPLLRRFWPYAFIVLSLLALVPVLWWNSQNDWVMFQHSGQHFPIHRDEFPLSITTFLKFLGSQLGLMSPITWLLLAGVSGLYLLRLRKLDHSIQYLVIFSTVPLAGILLLSLRQGIHANWSAPFYLAGFILLAAWGVGELSSGPRFDRCRPLFRPGLILGACLTGLIYIVPFFLPMTPLGGGPLDATARVRGWQEMGERVGAVWERLPGKEKIFFLGTRRQFVSELAFYLPSQPRVFHWSGKKGIVDSQYEVWEGPTDKIGWDSLIVTDPSLKLPDDLRASFEQVEALGEVTIPLGDAGYRQLLLYRGHLLRSWPLVK